LRARLVQNVITASDDAVHSARQLGADKRVSMWQPDFAGGFGGVECAAADHVAEAEASGTAVADDQAGEE